MLFNFQNYFMYEDFVQTGDVTIDVADITFQNWNDHFNGILNILRDGIELDFVQKTFIKVKFNEDITIELSIVDFWFNLIMWYLIIRIGNKIEPKHIFFDEAITRMTIKKYIDTHFIEENRKKLPNIVMNNIIDDTLHNYRYVDEFAMYLCNTINLEDTIDLMNACPEFNSLMSADLSGVALIDIKDVGMNMTKRAIEIMKDSKKYLGRDHCLADSFRAMEGINDKQYREFAINIGTKPNGQGGVFPHIINRSFIGGGVNDLLSYMIESSSSRTAQIMSKTNVGESGHFARLLGLNNTDTSLHNDPDYDCDTRNYQCLIINNEKTLNMLRDRYYRLHINGMESIIKSDDIHLIGQTIYLRSPITCASNSRGQGICYKCYGDLAYANKDINIGKIAAEELSSKLTQILLSAKHLLETVIKEIEWSDRFDEIFEIEDNIIKLQQMDVNFKDYYMIIDPERIEQANEDDYKKTEYVKEDEEFDYNKKSYNANKEDEDEDGISAAETYNEYVEKFQILTNTRELITIESKGSDKMYLSNELNTLIRKKAKNVDGKLHIPLCVKRQKSDENDVLELPLFFITIANNELSKTMDSLMAIINKNSETNSMDRHHLLQKFIDTIIEGGLNVMAIHCEVILSNQVRKVDEILERPEWQYLNEPCNMLTLNQALTNNPSVVVSLLYQRLSKLLYNPLTFRKNKPSFMDLFFMETPQNYLNDTTNIRPAVKDTNVEPELRQPILR